MAPRLNVIAMQSRLNWSVTLLQVFAGACVSGAQISREENYSMPYRHQQGNLILWSMSRGYGSVVAAVVSKGLAPTDVTSP